MDTNKKIVTTPCPICGRPITHNNPGAEVCHMKCAIEDFKKNWKEKGFKWPNV